VRGSEHVATACKLYEQTVPELALPLKNGLRVLEFDCKGLLLVLLIEQDRLNEAERLTQELHTLAGAHGLDTSLLVSRLTQQEGEAVAGNKPARAEADRRAIESLAQGRVRQAIDMCSLTDAARARLFVGEYEAALAKAKDAHRLLETQPDAKRTPDSLFVLYMRGKIHLRLGEPQKALKVFEEGDALVPGILAEVKDDPQNFSVANYEVAKFYGKMTVAQLLLNQTEKALTTVDKALNAARASGLGGLADFLGLDRLKAQVELNGHPDDRAEATRKALEIMAGADDIVGRSVLSVAEGLTPTVATKFIKDFPQIVALASREDRIQLHSSLARALERIGNQKGAIQNYLTAIRLIEESRIQVQGTEALATFFSAYVDVYDGAVDALHRVSGESNESVDPNLREFGRTYPEVALYFSEAAHARQFSERYGPTLLDGFGVRANLPESVRNHERELRREVGNTIDPAFGCGQALPNPLVARQRSEEATRTYVEFLDSLKLQYPEFATLAFPRPVEIEQLPASLNGKFIVAYKVTDRGVYWWIIFNRHVTDFGYSPTSKEDLRKNVGNFRRFIDDPAQATPLFNTLVRDPFSQIEKMASGHGSAPSRIIIVPDDALYLLPWEALPGLRGGYLADDFVISYAPSLTVLAQTLSASRPGEQRKTALVVGNVQDQKVTIPIQGRLESFEALGRDELDKIIPVLRSGGYQPVVIERTNATPDALLNRDETQYVMVHLDAHAFAETLDPLPSLILHPSPASPLGLLTLPDIAKLKLRARLVTLSSCETGLGKESNPLPGEGVEGLARMFMLAGSKSVLASLWLVRPDAAQALMENFYKEIGSGRPPDEAVALFRAKTALRNGAYKDPSLWAPFILIGDPEE